MRRAKDQSDDTSCVSLHQQTMHADAGSAPNPLRPRRTLNRSISDVIDGCAAAPRAPGAGGSGEEGAFGDERDLLLTTVPPRPFLA